MSNYRRANTEAQWFADNYPGSHLELSEETTVVVLHTTETSGWPPYEGGATAPNYTARPNLKYGILEWRAHFPDEMSARALRNESGGVETNTLNAIQVELIGTCDPSKRKSWGGMKAGVDYIFWPDAPDSILKSLARFLVDIHKRHGLRLEAPNFLSYPESYGSSSVRFSGAKWRGFTGICGHQHVPENSHGDPGNLNIERVLQFAEAILNPPVLRLLVANPDGEEITRQARRAKLRDVKSDLVFTVGEKPSIEVRDDRIKTLDQGFVEITPRRGFAWGKVVFKGKSFLLIARSGDQRREGWLPSRILNYRKESRAIKALVAEQGGEVILAGCSPRFAHDLQLKTVSYGRKRIGFPKATFDVSDHFSTSAPGATAPWLIVDLERPR